MSPRNGLWEIKFMIRQKGRREEYTLVEVMGTPADGCETLCGVSALQPIS